MFNTDKNLTFSSLVDDSPLILTISLVRSANTLLLEGGVVLFTTMWCMYCCGSNRLQATAILMAVASLSPVRTHTFKPLDERKMDIEK